MSRPPAVILAETARLTSDQRAFRTSMEGRLDLALPRDVWLDHGYSVLPREIGRPRGTPRRGSVDGGQEPWFDFTQVVKRGVNPRAKPRPVVVVSGGTMSNMGSRRR